MVTSCFSVTTELRTLANELLELEGQTDLEIKRLASPLRHGVSFFVPRNPLNPLLLVAQAKPSLEKLVGDSPRDQFQQEICRYL